MAMSKSRPTVTSLRQPAYGARSFTSRTPRAASCAAMMEHVIARGREILTAAGATDICVNSPIPYGGWHLLGTARMGNDPERSVVNEWGRSHDVKNLFIVDGSVFVTSGGVNPTSTIQAIALYVADQMKRRLADLFDLVGRCQWKMSFQSGSAATCASS